MNNITQSQIFGVVRWALTIGGTLLAAHGIVGPHDVITPERWDFIVGALLTLTPVIWSWWEKARLLSSWKARLGLLAQVLIQSGIQMTAANQAIAVDGKQIMTDAVKPVFPVSPKAALEIVRNFAPEKVPGATREDVAKITAEILK